MLMAAFSETLHVASTMHQACTCQMLINNAFKSYSGLHVCIEKLVHLHGSPSDEHLGCRICSVITCHDVAAESLTKENLLRSLSSSRQYRSWPYLRSPPCCTTIGTPPLMGPVYARLRFWPCS